MRGKRVTPSVILVVLFAAVVLPRHSLCIGHDSEPLRLLAVAANGSHPVTSSGWGNGVGELQSMQRGRHSHRRKFQPLLAAPSRSQSRASGSISPSFSVTHSPSNSPTHSRSTSATTSPSPSTTPTTSTTPSWTTTLSRASTSESVSPSPFPSGTHQIFSRSTLTPTPSSTSTVTGSRTISMSPAIRSSSETISATLSVHQTRSSLTPSVTPSIRSTTRSERVSKSTITPSLTASVSVTASAHITKSTITPSDSLTASNSTSRSLSISNNSLARSMSASVSSTLTLTNSSTMTPPPTPTMTISPSGTDTVTLLRSRSHSLPESPTLELSASNTTVPTATDTATPVESPTAAVTRRSHSLSAVITESALISRSVSFNLTATVSPSPSHEVSLSLTSLLTPSRTLLLSNTVPRTVSPSLDVPPAGLPCRRPFTNMIPAITTFSDKDIQNNTIVMWFNLTGVYRWSVVPQGSVVGRVVSTGSQPERLGWSYAVTINCSIYEDKYRMRCIVPPAPKFSLLVAQQVDIVLLSSAYEIQCSTSELVVYRFDIATETPMVLFAARTISAILGVEGFFASWFGAQSMVYDGQLLAMVGQMSCASTLDDFMTMRLLYLVAPMNDYGYVAHLYFNMLIVLVFLTVHVVVTYLIMKKKDIQFNDASEITTFPGLSFCCAVAVHAGITYGTFQNAINSSNLGEAIGSAGGFAYMIAMFTVVFYSLRRFAKVSYVEYGFLRQESWLKQMVLPSGFWDPKQPRQMFGRMLVTVRGGRLTFVPYQMVVITLFSVLSSIRPSDVRQGCRTLFYVMAACLVVVSVNIAVWRPHRVPIQNVITSFVMMLLAAQCCLQAESSVNNELNFDMMKAGLWILQFVVIGIRAFYDISLVLWENTKWGLYRQPQFGVLDEDHFALEDHTVELEEGFVFDELAEKYYQQHQQQSDAVNKEQQDERQQQSPMLSSARGGGNIPTVDASAVRSWNPSSERLRAASTARLPISDALVKGYSRYSRSRAAGQESSEESLSEDDML